MFLEKSLHLCQILPYNEIKIRQLEVPQFGGIACHSRTPPNSHLSRTATSHGRPLCLQGCSVWPRLHSHSGLYFRNPCYAATSLLLQ